MKDHALTSEPTALPLDASMLNGLPDPVLLVDANHEIVDFNRAAKQLFGADVLGAKLETTVASTNIHEAIDSTLDGVPGSRTEMFLPYPIARNYELNVWRLPDLKSLGPAWAMVVLHDVTASKQAAQMRADFVANVSHELRPPLSSLLGFIETLRGPARDDVPLTERLHHDNFTGIILLETVSTIASQTTSNALNTGCSNMPPSVILGRPQ